MISFLSFVVEHDYDRNSFKNSWFKNYVEKTFDSSNVQFVKKFYDRTWFEIFINNLFNEFYKIVSNSKMTINKNKQNATSRLIVHFENKIFIQNYSNFVSRMCYEIVTYMKKTNKKQIVKTEIWKQ